VHKPIYTTAIGCTLYRRLYRFTLLSYTFDAPRCLLACWCIPFFIIKSFSLCSQKSHVDELKQRQIEVSRITEKHVIDAAVYN